MADAGMESAIFYVSDIARRKGETAGLKKTTVRRLAGQSSPKTARRVREQLERKTARRVAAEAERAKYETAIREAKAQKEVSDQTDSYLTPTALARHRRNLPIIGKIVLYAGRFGAGQPVDMLIDVAPLLAERVRPLHFVIVGDGVGRKRLEDAAKARGVEDMMVFVGNVPDYDLTQYVEACDIGVCLYEAFGGRPSSFAVHPFWPYMSTGRAIVVASDSAETRRFIQQTDIGCAATVTGRRSDDILALQLALSSMLTDDRARARRAENARGLGREIAADGRVLARLRDSIKRQST